MEITIGLALIAGLVSFISPCVLPLVPAYIGYMGGRMTNSVASGAGAHTGTIAVPIQTRLSTFTHGLFFVAGFSLVFISIGLMSTAFIQQVGGENIHQVTSLIGRLGGILIILFGLHFMGILPRLFARLRVQEARLDHPAVPLLIGLLITLLILWGFTGSIAIWNTDAGPVLTTVSVILTAFFWLWLVMQDAFSAPRDFVLNTLTRIETALYSDTRRQFNTARSGNHLSSAAMGVVFSAGWTPCIGPVYGAVLTMAASGGDVSQAGVLLGMYSLGLGIPFLLTALLLDGAGSWLRRLQRHMRKIELASGMFLVIIGFTVATGQLQRLSERFAGEFAEFSVSVEERVLNLVTGGSASESIQSAPDSAVVAAEAEVVIPEEAAPDEARDVGLGVGQFAPDFQTVTADGDPVSLSALQGDVVLLNFWATWCGPCRVEMPAFQRQFERYAEQGFAVLAVNNAESVADVVGFRDELALTFPLAMDPRAQIQRQYGVFSYPSTFLIDRDGRIIARHFGLLTDQQIDQMLAEADLFS